MLQIKGVDFRSKDLQRATKAVRIAHETIYRAVAFDIDGTLTDANSTKINEGMASEIAGLLRRGVSVLLITGRGRSSAKTAVGQIMSSTNLDLRYASRLSCITHNGLLWLRSPVHNPWDILRDEIKLASDFGVLPQIREYLFEYDIIREGVLNQRIKISDEPSDNPLALRLSITASEHNTIENVREVLRELVVHLAENDDVFVSSGSFGNLVSYDISNTNKTRAVAFYCNRTGIRLEEILRVGDRGDRGGNDFEFLNSSRAFSVDRLSSDAEKCFPILDESSYEQLTGIAATQQLLKRVKIFPPLTLTPDPEHNLLKALHKFEQAALVRARREYNLLFEKMKLRINRLLIGDSSDFNVETIGTFDIYQRLNGGIRIRDWEIQALPPSHPARSLFDLSDAVFCAPGTEKMHWAVYTDDSILLRGHNYYWAMTHEKYMKESGYMAKYVQDTKLFISDATETVKFLLNEEPDLVRFKFLLAIMDNLRNILIQLQHAVYISEILERNGFVRTKKLFSSGLLRHTDLHLDGILNANLSWKRLLIRYQKFLEEMPSLLDLAYETATPYEFSYHKTLIRKWRECDDFLQNVLAVEIGLSEFEGIILSHNTYANHMLAIGLVYGGIELPAIASVLARKMGLPLTAGYMNLSLYANLEIRDALLSGEIDLPDLVEQQKDKLNTLVLFDDVTRPYDLSIYTTIILDDNCTTGRTLQGARDLLIQQKAEVLGAVTVRYPATNRYVQMQFPGHGLPDPEVLLSFIRGLVSPSPYTRLSVTAMQKKTYLDVTDVFDLSRAQLQRFLKLTPTTLGSNE